MGGSMDRAELFLPVNLATQWDQGGGVARKLKRGGCRRGKYSLHKVWECGVGLPGM